MRLFEFKTGDSRSQTLTEDGLREEIIRTRSQPINRVELLQFLLSLPPNNVLHMHSLDSDLDLWVTVLDADYSSGEM